MAEDLKTPSTEELEKLPRWARVAFAARCARRVQPLFKASWPGAPAEHVKALATGAALAETAGANAYCNCIYGYSVADIVPAAANASSAANHATGAAYFASNAASASSAAASASSAAAAYYAAKGADAGRGSVGRAMQGDFELLSVAAAPEEEGGEAWTDDTPVPPAFFGPLWPGGPPEGWPVEEDTSDECELEFEIEVPEGVSDEELCEKAIELADHADDLHRAYGGRGLKVKTIEVFEEAGVREGVTS